MKVKLGPRRMDEQKMGKLHEWIGLVNVCQGRFQNDVLVINTIIITIVVITIIIIVAAIILHQASVKLGNQFSCDECADNSSLKDLKKKKSKTLKKSMHEHSYLLKVKTELKSK